ncbi:MAG: exodeoxyribonuclease III [Endozoicomonadaceae bacterium]|nr:exodeoxyribonuclease III [Endozoicomonadaceae bacterium]
MRVISFNAEGLSHAVKKGFLDWVIQQDFDLLCIQNTQMTDHDFQNNFQIPNYYAYSFENYASSNPKTNGVAIYSRVIPKAMITGINDFHLDSQGRYLQLDFNSISISSLLVPGCVTDLNSSQEKYHFLDAYWFFLKKQNRKRRSVITCGTFNIAHKAKDVACYEDHKIYPAASEKEQQWMDNILKQMQYVDCYREVEQADCQFNFWENEVNRKNNIGWRTDYQIATKNLKPQILTAGLYTRDIFSRHAPVIVDYEWELTQ